MCLFLCVSFRVSFSMCISPCFSELSVWSNLFIINNDLAALVKDYRVSLYRKESIGICVWLIVNNPFYIGLYTDMFRKAQWNRMTLITIVRHHPKSKPTCPSHWLVNVNWEIQTNHMLGVVEIGITFEINLSFIWIIPALHRGWRMVLWAGTVKFKRENGCKRHWVSWEMCKTR